MKQHYLEKKDALMDVVGKVQNTYILESMGPGLAATDTKSTSKVFRWPALRRTAVILAAAILIAAITVGGIVIAKKAAVMSDTAYAEIEYSYTTYGYGSGESVTYLCLKPGCTVCSIFNPTGAEKIIVNIPEVCPDYDGDLYSSDVNMEVVAYQPANLRWLAPIMMTLDDYYALLDRIGDAINTASRKKGLKKIDWKTIPDNNLVTESGNDEWEDYIKFKAMYTIISSADTDDMKSESNADNDTAEQLAEIARKYPQVKEVGGIAVSTGSEMETETLLKKWVADFTPAECLTLEDKAMLDVWNIYTYSQKIKRSQETDNTLNAITLKERIKSLEPVDYLDQWEQSKALYEEEKDTYRTPVFRCQIVEIILPDTVDNIDENAIAGTSIKTFDIPSETKKIDQRLFILCNKLKKITCGGESIRLERSDGYILAREDELSGTLMYSEKDYSAIKTFSRKELLLNVRKTTDENRYVGDAENCFVTYRYQIEEIANQYYYPEKALTAEEEETLQKQMYKQGSVTLCSEDWQKIVEIWRKYDSQKESAQTDSYSEVVFYPFDAATDRLNGVKLEYNTYDGIFACRDNDTACYEWVIVSEEDRIRINRILYDAAE